MAVLFAAGEWEAFRLPSGSPTWSTSAAYYDNQFARGAMLGLNQFADLPNPVSEVWVHAELHQANSWYSGNVPFELQSSAGTGVLRVACIATGNPQLQYYNGSAWVNIGSMAAPIATRFQLDVHARIADVGGVFEIFVNGIQTAVYTGDTNLFAGADIARMRMPEQAWYALYWSQVIITDVDDTRSMKLATLGVNSNGTPQEWTGSYTDIDEVGTYNDADYISSSTPNQVSMFGLTDLSATAATLDVIAVVTSSRGRRGAAGPQNLQMGVKTGGVDYFSGNLPGLSPVFNPLPQVIWDTNPGTSLPWSTSDVNSLNMGFKSTT